ncbi:hypothetical protein [Pseudomonas sp. OIL-1]|uniref:hypothetical protein n=1 Tax=Pseudomonas sp. OIL-1 TaxID=2706126 RepID=UPI0013A787EB|nr:hypothetical protein [Pseudomonas sp. OIL-1]QIB52617.1 hypothetical protein G3M63_17140 [Pseudomonas sp. OIL-1]
MKKILRLPVVAARQAALIFRDLKMSLRLPAVQSETENGITYRGMHRSELTSINNLYVLMNGGSNIALARRFVYWLVGNKIVIVVSKKEQGEEKIIGLNMFYFNKKDVRQNTIHDGFVGIEHSFQGLGIGSRLRRKGVVNFGGTYLSGISSRIDVDNKASLAVTLKVGAEPVEQYTDPVTGAERYYLINWFDK